MINTNILESANSPSLTSAVIFAEPLKFRAGIMVNWLSSTDTKTFSLSLKAENVRSVLSVSTSVADRLIINDVSSFVTWLPINPSIGGSFKLVTYISISKISL